MPATDSMSAAIIVARFLKSNNYNESYDAFVNEAGLPSDAGSVSAGDLTLETLLEEKKTFDLASQFERLGTGDGTNEWAKPSPSNASVVSTLPASSNLLSAGVQQIDVGGTTESLLFATTADRRLSVLDTPSCSLSLALSGLQDGPILSCQVFRGKYLLLSSMSGQLVLAGLSGNVIEKRRDHAKYVVQIAQIIQSEQPLLATAGWDNKINVYKPTASDPPSIGEPISTISLPTKPESMVFLQHPESQQPILLISRTDSSHMHYYTVDAEPRLLGRQNLAPHSNAWVAFTPASLALCPTDSSLVAVGTSSLPHMKLLIVRLLIPPWDATSTPAPAPSASAPALRASLLDDTPVQETQASQARAALALADREHAAIQIHCTTMAPQTAYSTPAVAWRPGGSGVWVNGDDGAIRGVETSSGKIVATLMAHEPGSKVRSLWAGKVGEEEWLVSGGFDHKLIVWRT